MNLVEQAAAPVLGIIDDIRSDQLDAPTPCAEFDVRRLIRHLLFWGPALEAAARKEPPFTPAGAEADVDLDGWQPRLAEQLERTATAWSAPAAWTGVTSVGSPQELPAEVVGGMTVTEVLVHGWDLATAVGLRPVWDGDLLAFVHRDLLGSAGMGRELGLYGPEVPVPDDAPMLDRVLGLTGRKA
ncbi:uncharacterized protein (TIGR03086 family) [Saccharothrix tamanrassetensis]|uniref:Uncharacterized protein (TIGR03086 family) n=1 Tax=Saccharothrix tamanrassetensis TaxID=1051531 RepID=A0A841CYF0_9PSEU|nr:TIGR03086 family metal-binding protein [Saccharothrix tamanrassetensis]MBB5960356.1 uncharacterized protein (TIGR03086 family) [Saccharothrix tamanrassetensis]